MKKTLNFFAAAALVAFAAVACQKEQLSDISSEGEETVTFTVQTDAAATKATADNDGRGAGLSRCLVAVYMKTGNSAEPYKLYDTPSTTKQDNEHYSFTVNLIRKQTYQIVVWADKGKYTVSPDLSSVTRIADDEACNSDAYDAFYASVPFTQGTTASTPIIAKRPFAQLNLITKDLREGFEPKDIELTYTADTKFNPFDGTTSEPQKVTYTSTTPHYGASLANPVPAENTVAMNYLFANNEQSVLNEVKLKATFTDAVELAVANVPVRRNYRTNIKGNLFTEQTDYTITVDPAWSGETDVEWVSVATVAEANTALQAGKTNVAIESVAADSEILIPETSKTIGISLPSGNTNAVTIAYKNPSASGQTPNLNVTAESNTGNLVIEAPQSHVTLNGVEYENVTASTSNTTLVVEEDVTITNLTINAGGLEIHGTVNTLAINPSEGATVIVRDCEGLSQAVYDVAKNFLAPGYVGTKTGGKWNIALSKYWAERVAEVPVGYIENQTEKTVTISTPEGLAWMAHRLNVDKFSFSKYTISITEDIDLSAAYWKPAGGNGGVRFQGTFDGRNHTISGMEIIENNGYGNAFFGDMSGSPVIKNITFDQATVQRGYPQYSGNVYGIVAAYCYGDVLFENVHVTNSKLFGFGKVGCILGMAADPGTHVTRMHNCSVTNTSVWYVYNASYFAGLIQNQADMQNLTFTNCSRHCGISAITLDTKAYNGEESVDVKGEYWEYPYGDEVYMYAAWGDYYTDYHYSDWSLTDLGSNYYVSDGLCHNEI